MDVRLSLGWSNLHRSAARELFNALQGASQALSRAKKFGCTAVGFKLATATNRHLNQRGRDRRQHRDEKQGDGVGAIFIVTAATKECSEIGHLGDCRNCGCNSCCNRANQDVSVADMHQFMGHDSFKFIGRH